MPREGVRLALQVVGQTTQRPGAKTPSDCKPRRDAAINRARQQRANLLNKLALSSEKGSFSGSHQLPQRSKKSIKSLIFTSPSPLKSGQIS